MRSATFANVDLLQAANIICPPIVLSSIEKKQTQLQNNVLQFFIAALAPSRLSIHTTGGSIAIAVRIDTPEHTHSAPDVDELHDGSVRAAYEDSSGTIRGGHLLINEHWAYHGGCNEAARIVSMLDAQWAPWLGWISSQLNEVPKRQGLDFIGIYLLNWFNGP
ncbi:hypothetical protein EDD85DRAFT_950381 [Armillaria nabsnona]|nr:hypothetical protein EDD85DRAFT_950381 [Armillaria nabsnona]